MNSEREYQAFLADRTSLQAEQRKVFDELLQRNADCGYGRRHGFGSIASLEQYQRLPLVRYETLTAAQPEFWSEPANYTTERALAFFLTSGSTSAPKRIPVTPSLVRQKARAFGVFWGSIYAAHPTLENGNFIANFSDSGRSQKDERGVPMLSETTFWNQRMQGMQDPERWPIGKQVARLESAADKYYAVVRLALQKPLHCLMTLNPSTLVKFCETLTARAAELERGLADGTWGAAHLDRDAPAEMSARLQRDAERARQVGRAVAAPGHWQLRELWPELELLISWQSELVEPYLRLLAKHAEGVARRDYITQSSECIMAIPIADSVSGGPLAYKSHFFEFIPEEEAEKERPLALFAWQLERDRRYEIVVSTGGGLYRYRMGDCVVVNDFLGDVPILEFKYRLGKTSSMTGEKLTEIQVLQAIRAANSTGAALDDVLVFPSTAGLPHYAALTAAPVTTAELRAWIDRFEIELGRANPEYFEKRDSMRLATPRLLRVAGSTLQRVKDGFRAAHTGDDQFKPSQFSNKRDLDQNLEILETARADS